MKTATPLFMAVAFLGSACAAETKMKLEDLPAAVQAAVKAQTKDATLAGIGKEKENGRTVYEVETKGSNGKTRDLIMDSSGAVMETEEEVDLDSIPAAARAGLEKKAAGGTITKVEKLTKGSVISYEAATKSKAGKKREILVSAEGR